MNYPYDLMQFGFWMVLAAIFCAGIVKTILVSRDKRKERARDEEKKARSEAAWQKQREYLNDPVSVVSVWEYRILYNKHGRREYWVEKRDKANLPGNPEKGWKREKVCAGMDEAMEFIQSEKAAQKLWETPGEVVWSEA